MRTTCIPLVAVAGALLGGCAVPDTPQTPRPYTLELDPVSGREYYLYVPSTYRHDQPAPLIVSCHGTPPYDVAEHHVREWKWYGEQNGCLVLAPKLIGTDGLIGDGPIVGMTSNERYILGIISQLGYRYNIDKANILITGFSGGGFPTYWVGLRNPEVFSAVVARNCNFSEGNLRDWYPPEALETPVMVYYGSNDPAAIQIQSKAAVRFLKANGFSVETAVIPGAGHQRHPEVAMAFFRKHWRPARPSLSVARAPNNHW